MNGEDIGKPVMKKEGLKGELKKESTSDDPEEDKKDYGLGQDPKLSPA